METKNAKVLGNGRRVMVDLKRKRTPHCETYVSGVARKLLKKRTSSFIPINKVVKKRKLDVSTRKFGGCSSQSKASLLKCYSNFTRSGIPQRVMYYQNGEWNDYPRDFVTLVKKDMLMKKAVTEVNYNGHRFILDFLHMVRLDSVTGSQQSIAWIDDTGKCFFPETFSGNNEHRECCFGPPAPAYQDIRLRLEIEVKESDCSKFNDYSGDSSANVKLIHVNENFVTGSCDLDAEDSCAKPSDVGESKEKDKYGVHGIDYGDLDCDAVRKLFLMGMGSSVRTDIVDLYRGSSSSSTQARLELFYKQIEITTKYRGNANVRYAWFPSTKEALSTIMTYGLGHIESSETKSTYGVGIHLSPANCTFNSASSCDIDENGVRHMVLCRVIMGNMELVNEGSKQFHPSGEGFDSGVDDLQNPSHYIVWNMNNSTHVYPEYAVSFKISADAAGVLIINDSPGRVSRLLSDDLSPELGSSKSFFSIGLKVAWSADLIAFKRLCPIVICFVPKNVRKLDISRVTACSPEPPIPSRLATSPAQLVPGEIVQEKVPNLGPSTIRSPKSPWVSLPTLLAALSTNTPPEKMKLLQSDYELLRSKKIERKDFISKLRLTVGDALLKTAITSFYSKVMPEYGSNLVA